MKICIPTLTNTGLDAQVHGHFGSAPYFTLVDTANQAVETVSNTNAHHAHGMCHPLGVLEGRHIDAVVCSGMGGRAVQKLNLAGIKAFRAAAGTVEEIIRQVNQGGLEEITVHNACAQHDCHK
jgi:predicted Fe-Mo cluster-binding NifX family protein